MNKAFIKESEEDDELDGSPQLPQGVKNYITPSGHKQLVDEFDQLWKVERPELVKPYLGQHRTAIARKMPTTSTASGGCARSTGGFAS